MLNGSCMKFGISILAITFSLIGFHSSSYAQVSFLRSVKKQELLSLGRVAYENRCSGCHGLLGDGKGPASRMLNPKPRDFTKGIYKFKSTALGEMPTDEDLVRVIHNGIPGTSMPSFRLVSDQEKRAIAQYVKSFAANEFKRQSYDKVIPELALPKDVFNNKEKFLAYARRGRVWFDINGLGCANCHGVTGVGDGPGASALRDPWGDAIKPANLTKKTIKRGRAIQDIAKSIALGIEGPMPSHLDVFGAELESKFPELKSKTYIWELAAYVFYLRGQAAGFYSNEIPPIPSSGLPADEVQKVVGQYFGSSSSMD